jgi:hypothetical protein
MLLDLIRAGDGLPGENERQPREGAREDESENDEVFAFSDQRPHVETGACGLLGILLRFVTSDKVPENQPAGRERENIACYDNKGCPMEQSHVNPSEPTIRMYKCFDTYNLYRLFFEIQPI